MSRIMDEKLDRIVTEISEINVTLGKQSVILEEHIRRTNLLEQKLEPVEKHVAMVNGVFKAVGLFAAGAAIIEAIMQATK